MNIFSFPRMAIVREKIVRHCGMEHKLSSEAHLVIHCIRSSSKTMDPLDRISFWL